MTSIAILVPLSCRAVKFLWRESCWSFSLCVPLFLRRDSARSNWAELLSPLDDISAFFVVGGRVSNSTEFYGLMTTEETEFLTLHHGIPPGAMLWMCPLCSSLGDLMPTATELGDWNLKMWIRQAWCPGLSSQLSRKLRQEDHKFKFSLGDLVRPCFKIKS